MKCQGQHRERTRFVVSLVACGAWRRSRGICEGVHSERVSCCRACSLFNEMLKAEFRNPSRISLAGSRGTLSLSLRLLAYCNHLGRRHLPRALSQAPRAGLTAHSHEMGRSYITRPGGGANSTRPGSRPSARASAAAAKPQAGVRLGPAAAAVALPVPP